MSKNAFSLFRLDPFDMAHGLIMDRQTQETGSYFHLFEYILLKKHTGTIKPI
jgi:hypothetical protein